LLPQLTLGPKQTQLLQGLSAYGKAVRRLQRWHDYRFCGADYVPNYPGWPQGRCITCRLT
jgi:hypothetical protein